MTAKPRDVGVLWHSSIMYLAIPITVIIIVLYNSRWYPMSMQYVYSVLRFPPTFLEPNLEQTIQNMLIIHDVNHFI